MVKWMQAIVCLIQRSVSQTKKMLKTVTSTFWSTFWSTSRKVSAFFGTINKMYHKTCLWTVDCRLHRLGISLLHSFLHQRKPHRPKRMSSRRRVGSVRIRCEGDGEEEGLLAGEDREQQRLLDYGTLPQIVYVVLSDSILTRAGVLIENGSDSPRFVCNLHYLLH
ncbi:hypothetical protein L917_14868 [Phytophthora nicotianae]|uniref:Uncharacterized protein n=1 Tax=Phytophthora nicotianae TaxID=4792 RepID=W2KMS4_PHYNI|nr:hypothetical protein L917_14868 [Phytophthora nicotianae]